MGNATQFIIALTSLLTAFAAILAVIVPTLAKARATLDETKQQTGSLAATAKRLDEVHGLVNGHRSALVAHITELTAILKAHNIDVPLPPEPPVG